MAETIYVTGLSPQPVIIYGVGSSQTITVTGQGSQSIGGSGTATQLVVSGTVAQAGPQGIKGDTGTTGATGPQGLQGIQGIQGIQGPTGATGPAGNADKNFSQAFTGATTVSVTHNLSKYPAVTIIDTAGDECEAMVNHVSTNNLTVTFSSGNSGTVYCN
jgi:hypothetical protein